MGSKAGGGLFDPLISLVAGQAKSQGRMAPSDTVAPMRVQNKTRRPAQDTRRAQQTVVTGKEGGMFSRRTLG